MLNAKLGRRNSIFYSLRIDPGSTGPEANALLSALSGPVKQLENPYLLRWMSLKSYTGMWEKLLLPDQCLEAVYTNSQLIKIDDCL